MLVDDQCSVVTELEAVAKALAPFTATLMRGSHKAGSLSLWLLRELKALGIPVVYLEMRQVPARDRPGATRPTPPTR